MDRDKRELLTTEYGFTQYQEGLNQVQQVKDEYARQAVEDRKRSDADFDKFLDDERLERFEQMRKKQNFSGEMIDQMHQDYEQHRTMAMLDDEQAMRT